MVPLIGRRSEPSSTSFADGEQSCRLTRPVRAGAGPRKRIIHPLLCSDSFCTSPRGLSRAFDPVEHVTNPTSRGDRCPRTLELRA